MATLFNIGKAASLRPPSGQGFGLVFSQLLGKGPPTAKAYADRLGIKVWQIFGSSIGQPPQPQQVAEQMISQGVATAVNEMEIWEQDQTILGTGWIVFWYITIYLPGPNAGAGP
ncbi:MAG: hypothetical protein ABSH07_12655 [Candidatus Dormibacteria bacterium]